MDGLNTHFKQWVVTPSPVLLDSVPYAGWGVSSWLESLGSFNISVRHSSSLALCPQVMRLSLFLVLFSCHIHTVSRTHTLTFISALCTPFRYLQTSILYSFLLFEVTYSLQGIVKWPIAVCVPLFLLQVLNQPVTTVTNERLAVVVKLYLQHWRLNIFCLFFKSVFILFTVFHVQNIACSFYHIDSNAFE